MPQGTGQYDTRQEPTDSELFDIAARELQLSIRTCTVGKLIEIDPLTRTGKVQIQILAVVEDELTNGQIVSPPVSLQGIQILQPFGLGGYLTFPLQVGDTGIVLIFDRDISDWSLTGAPGKPKTFTLHNQSSAVFIPGFLPGPIASQNPVEPTAAVLEATLINVGAGAVQAAVLGDDLLTKLNEIINVLNTHVHNYTSPIPAAAGPVIPTLTPIPQQPALIPTDFQSQKVSIE